jgi:hypothetical protein
MMPKTNDGSGPTYYGMEGHVVDSHDRVHEVDPSRTVTGEVVEGFESDEREMEDRDVVSGDPHPVVSPSDGLPAAPTPVEDVPPVDDAIRRDQERREEEDPAKRSAPEKEKTTEEVASSRGSNSPVSRASNAKSSEKKTSGK